MAEILENEIPKQNSETIMTAKMAGDLGDCVMAMACFRALGGGTLLLHAERWTREPMTEAKVRSLRSLLINQSYVEDVRWLKPDDKVDVNLNDFRATYFRDFKKPDFPKQRNLCEWILRTHRCDPEEQNKQWLQVVPHRVASVVINRTGAGRQAPYIYRNRAFPWRKIVEKYQDEIILVGSPEEHGDFVRQFGWVSHYHTANLLDLARVIAGAELFAGNQSCAYSIAEGLKKPAILEVCPWLPNCLFHRSDVVHGWDANIDLPDLPSSRMTATTSVSGESARQGD